MASNRSPSVGNAVPAFSLKYSLRILWPIVDTDELVTAGIKPIYITVDSEYRIMITSFTVFCFVIYLGISDFYLTN